MTTPPQRRPIEAAPLVMTPSEAGAALGCSSETVRRLIASGELRARKLGGVWAVDGAAVARRAAIRQEHTHGE